jgi:hypothetical protein
MKCDQLPESVDISWGKFSTSNNFSDYTYSYYRSADDTHFTVTGTNGGSGEFQKFHISTGSFNAHIWFDQGYPAPDNPWDNDGGWGTNLPSAEKQQFTKWAQDNWADIKANASEFWTKCNGG